MTIHGTPEELREMQYRLSLASGIIEEYENETGKHFGNTKKALQNYTNKVEEQLPRESIFELLKVSFNG